MLTWESDSASAEYLSDRPEHTPGIVHFELVELKEPESPTILIDDASILLANESRALVIRGDINHFGLYHLNSMLEEVVQDYAINADQRSIARKIDKLINRHDELQAQASIINLLREII